MRSVLIRSALRATAISSAVLGALFGFLFAIFQSDFVQRDCHNIPPQDWIYTANCTDAYNAVWLTGWVTFGCLLAFCTSVWKLRYV
jgi:hypothetical protein